MGGEKLVEKEKTEQMLLQYVAAKLNTTVMKEERVS